MRPTPATDTCFIPAPSDRIFAILMAVDRYALWWPENIGVQVLTSPPHGVGSVIAVRLAKSGGGFRCRIADAEAPRRVMVEYIEGPHRGRGEWVLDPAEGGTQVSYSVDLKPHGLAMRILSHLMDFPGAHARLTREVLDGLARAATASEA